MMMHKGLGCVGIMAALLGAQSLKAEGAARGNKATVEILSSVKSVVPGQEFDVGIRFRMQDGWHIYWQNPGDAGMAPRVKWTLPAGFTAGGLTFPVPRKHVSPGDIVTNIFEEEAVLLVRLTPPSSLTSSQVSISGQVNYLICRENCIPETAEIKLELPVDPPGQATKSDNDEVFARARKRLPAKTSKYVSLTPVVSTPTLRAGQDFEVTINLEVAPGFHIQSHEPLQESLFKADLLLERLDGVYFEKPVFPPGQLRPVKVLGQLSEFSGKVSIRVPGKVDDPAPAGPLHFAGLFLYQACNDQGTCFPPDALSFSITQAIAEGPKAPAATPAPAGGSVDSTKSPTAPPTVSNEDTGRRSYLGWLLFAFVGGLILNVMPCVLPVISIKVLSLVQQADEEPAKVFRLGMTFVTGVVLSFVALALVVIGLKSARPLGWGFQFQNPTFVIVMTSVVFLFGLSLFGVYTISLPGSAVSKLAAAEGHEGYAGAFMKGLLGTVLATPCTAPYLGPALGWAFTARNDQLLAIFATVGLGMASPFVVLAIQPRWVRFLPRPGPWMEHFKQLMGFLLMGTVIWLLYPLGSQIGPRGLVLTMTFLAFLGLAAWIVGKQTPLTSPGKRAAGWLAAILISVLGWEFAFGRPKSSLDHLAGQYHDQCQASSMFSLPSPADWKDGIPWQPWSKGLGERLAGMGITVYVDYTADWCANCLTNKHTTLESDVVRAKMAELCVVPLKADFTHKDEDILADLTRFDRAGVPLNIIYPAGKPNAPIVLPELLVGRSPLVLEKLQAAGPSQQCASVASVTDSHPGT